MVGELMARKMRSGTGEGPGICKKWRPVGWKFVVSMRGKAFQFFRLFFVFKMSLSRVFVLKLVVTIRFFVFKISYGH
jgi:hypothetical protein